MQETINSQSMLKVGTVLRGIYRIESYLSSGGFGNTYVATNIEFDERVAIKEFFMKGVTQRDGNHTTVSVSNAENQDSFLEQREKFKKEARRLRKLANPHIVSVHDLFEENGTAYYVMDYIDGENLAERLKRTGKPMTEAEVNEILPQILDALKTVHDAGIWHLDLKPANIMLDKNGQVKIIDFGASKQLHAQKGGATTSTAICYTNGYAPREQMEQNYDKFGPWTDIYSLGATLYILLTNKKHPPLPTDIDDDTSNDKHLALPFPASVSESMKRRVLWMINTNRMQRPQNASTILNEDIDEDTIIEIVPPKLVQPLSNELQPMQKEEVKTITGNNSTKHRNRKGYWITSVVAIIVVGLILAISSQKVNKLSVDTEEKTDTVAVLDENIAYHQTVTSMFYHSALGDCSYTGEVDDENKPHGKGVAEWTSGDGLKYDGDWVHGVMEGQTHYIQRSGDTFVGMFKANKYYKGKYTINSSGDYFEGTFKNGQPDNGDWYDKNGNKY